MISQNGINTLGHLFVQGLGVLVVAVTFRPLGALPLEWVVGAMLALGWGNTAVGLVSPRFAADVWSRPAARIILPYEPSTIVFYAGDNDIANKRTPKQVTDDFIDFSSAIHEKLPKCRILFIAVKPSPSRWKLYEVQIKANDAVRELCKKDDRLAYIDVVAPMLGKDGKPIPELFHKDELHMTAKGYEIWTDLVKKALAEKR